MLRSIYIRIYPPKKSWEIFIPLYDVRGYFHAPKTAIVIEIVATMSDCQTAWPIYIFVALIFVSLL